MACGTPHAAGEKFCGDCGAALAVKAAAAGSPQASTAPDIRVAAEQPDTTTPPDGERKTVTALFADIKGSTELMEDLDPEEARTIIDPALKLMIEAVGRYGGYVVQSTGDGIFALFGAPVAHEDHPQRALYAALRLQEELKRYSTKVVADGNTPIQGRVGINTGEVVVRSIQTGAGQVEYTPIGHTTNLASRMQTAAPVGSIAVSENTRRLCEGYFILKPLGATRIKGVSEQVNVYEVTGLGPLRTRLQRAVRRGLTKFVGRELEMEALKHAAELARQGHGQIVAAMAEPGVGKSRLYFEFKATSQSGWMVLETFSISHGKASAYLPVLDLLQGYFKIASGDDERTRCEKVAGRLSMLDPSLEDTRPYLFSLLGIVEGADPLAQMDGQLRKRRTLEAIKRILLRESLNQPLMVIFEDLHWIDEATQELLNLLADSIGTAKLLLLVNYRPEYSHRWNSKTYYTQLRLDPLGPEIAEALLATLVGQGNELAPVRRLLIDKTEGNPFFLEEMVQGLFEQGALVRNGSVKLGKPLDSIRIPPTVRALLASRIDRLPAEEKNLLQIMAVIGTDFPAALLKRVVGASAEDPERKITALQTAAEFIYEQPAIADVEYTFKHALTQEVAYGSVLLERRKALHERIGDAIEALYSHCLEDRLDDLAHHFRCSGNPMKAIEYLRRAGERLGVLYAVRPALENFTAATDLLENIGDPAIRDRLEAGITVAALAPTAVALGEDSVVRQQLAERAVELGSRLNDRNLRFLALLHLANVKFISGDLLGHAALLDDMIGIASDFDDKTMAAEAFFMRSAFELWRGDFCPAVEDLDRAISIRARLSTAESKRFYWEPPEIFHAYAGFCRWLLGYPDQALASASHALSTAHASHRDYFMAVAQGYLGLVHQLRGEWGKGGNILEQAIALAEQRGFPIVVKINSALHRIGMDEMRAEPDGALLADFTTHASSDIPVLVVPYILESCARSLARLGRHDDAQRLLEDAFAASHRGPRWFEAELHRTSGELGLLRSPNTTELAERAFRDAIELARQQSARSLAGCGKRP
jgi:class 3 adenylate cyclase/tetratricopeptide (TPR) repeat protein